VDEKDDNDEFYGNLFHNSGQPSFLKIKGRGPYEIFFEVV